MSRCRLCTSNDRDALADELAGELWEAARDPDVDPTWAEAPPYWHHVFQMYARTTVRTLTRAHD